MKSIRPVVLTLLAGAAVFAAASAEAGVNVGVSVGYPGGYGIAQPAYVAPTYVAPAPVYVRPAPVYVESGRYAYPNWRERERERYWREHHEHHRGYDNGWHDHHDGDHRDHDRGEHHEGWRR